MNLPRELRDKIYGYLLRVDGFAILRDETPPDKLDLSILRVNQTLHLEASRTLYVENPWVCVIIEPGLLQTLRRLKAGVKGMFPGDRPISTGQSARIRAEAVATMTLQTLPHVDPAIDQIPLVVCLVAIPRLCKLFPSYIRNKKIDIAVYLNARNVGKVRKAWQERMVNWLGEYRGFGRAGVFSGQGNQPLVRLGALMMSPSITLQECFDQASAYQIRAHQKENSGQFSEARYDYQDSHNFIFWFSNSTYLDVKTLDESDISVGRSISDLMDAVSVSYAFLLIKLRDLTRALYHINQTLRSRLRAHRYSKDRFNIETAFVCGLRDLAIGADNGAAHCFLQILWLQPGHQGADNAVDEIESRLKNRTGRTELIILYNIEHVLQPFRHQKHGSAVMDQAAYGVLVERWLSFVEKVDSIGYRSRCGFSWGFDHDWVYNMCKHGRYFL